MPIPLFAVPAITSDEAERLFKTIKPIRIKGDKAFLITTKDLNNSFLWNAEKESKPYKGDLYVLDRLHTVHSYGYHGMFKPSITEVLAQIPKQYTYLKEVYFETVGPEDAHDLNLWIEHVHAGVHVARTVLYVPEPSMHLLSALWHSHPETLNMSANHEGPATSAIRWLEAMKPEDRVVALRFFCQKCGELLGQTTPIETDPNKPAITICNKCLMALPVRDDQGK